MLEPNSKTRRFSKWRNNIARIFVFVGQPQSVASSLSTEQQGCSEAIAFYGVRRCETIGKDDYHGSPWLQELIVLEDFLVGSMFLGCLIDRGETTRWQKINYQLLILKGSDDNAQNYCVFELTPLSVL
jgi:hypothetical protein